MMRATCILVLALVCACDPSTSGLDSSVDASSADVVGSTLDGAVDSCPNPGTYDWARCRMTPPGTGDKCRRGAWPVLELVRREVSPSVLYAKSTDGGATFAAAWVVTSADVAGTDWTCAP